MGFKTTTGAVLMTIGSLLCVVGGFIMVSKLKESRRRRWTSFHPIIIKNITWILRMGSIWFRLFWTFFICRCAWIISSWLSPIRLGSWSWALLGILRLRLFWPPWIRIRIRPFLPAASTSGRATAGSAYSGSILEFKAGISARFSRSFSYSRLYCS